MKVIARICTLALTVSEISSLKCLTLKIYVKVTEWSHSRANINLYKSHTEHFLLTLTVFKILSFQFYLENISHGRVQFALTPSDGKYFLFDGDTNVCSLLPFTRYVQKK